jgi:hypothetical protein
MGEMRNVYKLLGNGRDHLEDLDVDRRTFKWIFKKYGSRMWTGFKRLIMLQAVFNIEINFLFQLKGGNILASQATVSVRPIRLRLLTQ